ncbi:MAG: MMPL family transporter, partial [Candidatus Dormibacteraeota bacterium]|nr:MMPL family transporter [Candidatus Dormibacteraeota bacterium]
MLTAWGRIVHRHRLLVLTGSLLLLIASGAGLVAGGQTSSITFSDVGMPSQQAHDLMQREIPAKRSAPGSNFELMLHDAHCQVSQPACQERFLRALQPLQRDRRVSEVVTPYSLPPAEAAPLISAGGHTALVMVQVRSPVETAAGSYPTMVAQVRDAAPSGVQVQGTGQVEVEHAFIGQLHTDLGRAEVISLPITLVLLVLIFGSAVSALLPLAAGSMAVLVGSGAALLLARYFVISQYAPDVVSLIALGVSIDYSLFITRRFRDELARRAGVEAALATTLGTSGRAVAFSGLTVAVGLCSLLFFPGTLAPSVGIAGALGVVAAVIFALSFLPAMLSLLGPRIDMLRVLRPAERRPGGEVWRRLGIRVMGRPLAFLIPTMALLVLAGLPFLHVRMAEAGIQQLPPGNQARLSYDTLNQEFPAQRLNTITVVVYYPRGDPLSRRRVGDLYDLNRRMAQVDGVRSVSGPLDLGPQLTRADYEQLLTEPDAAQPEPVRTELERTVGPHIVTLNANTDAGVNSPAAQSMVGALRHQTVPGGTVMVTGQTALNEDAVRYILDRLPYAVGFVVVASLILLFLLTRSVLLPLKAVLSNAVSICASFGALVWIFQEGHLAGLLGFTPQPIDPSILVLLFAAVFGLSMDYEVLLVSRIQESYRETRNNSYATVIGLQQSGGLITGAAAIMVVVFAAFSTADVLLLKSVGLGLAIAIAIDATLVRAIVVPSVMR